MLLSPPSWVIFWLFVVIGAIGAIGVIWFILHKLFGENQELGEILYIGMCIYSVIVLVASLAVLIPVVNGGKKAQNIQDNLSSQGYIVSDIDLSSDKAEIVLDGKLVWVLLFEDGNGVWQPYEACALNISKNC